MEGKPWVADNAATSDVQNNHFYAFIAEGAPHYAKKALQRSGSCVCN